MLENVKHAKLNFVNCKVYPGFKFCLRDKSNALQRLTLVIFNDSICICTAILGRHGFYVFFFFFVLWFLGGEEELLCKERVIILCFGEAVLDI